MIFLAECSLGVDREDIANRIGASREMVARIMKDLATGNYISIDGKRLIINEKLPDAY